MTATPLYAAGVGQLASFAVTVAPPFTGTPSGTVQLLEGTIVLATTSIDAAGRARLETSALTEGTHHLHVTYGGDAQFNASESAGFSFTVLSSTPPQRRRAAGH